MQQFYQRAFLLMGLVCLVSTQACHGLFKQDFSKLERRCGRQEVGFRSIPLQSASGADLDDTIQARLHATWRVAGAESWAPLGFSSKGCLLWPEDQKGELVVGNDEQLLYQSLMQPDQPQLKLKEKINFNFEFDCSQLTAAGNASLPFPSLVTDMSGVSDLALIKIYAQPEKVPQGSLVSAAEFLWQSSQPLTLAKLPSTLDIRHLVEGTWQLIIEAGQWDPVKGDAALRKITDLGGCAFRVMRQVPAEVRLLNAKKDPSSQVTLYKDDLLPVNVPAGFELRSCVEPLEKGQLSCVKTESCLNPNSFIDSQRPRADLKGVHQIYLYLLDQAGNQGPMSCSELKVIDSKPVIQVRWANPEWQKPLAMMQRTPNRLAADVELKHEIISSAELESRLECRLEFVSFSGRHRPPRHARCQSGICQGREMNLWQRCGSHIEIELGQEWLEHDSWNGSWQIQVRVDDGTGMEHEDKAAIWFTQSQFIAKGADELGLTNDDWVVLMKTDQKGRIWTATRSGPLTRIHDGQAQIWPNPPQFFDKTVEVVDWIEGDKEQFFTLWQESSDTPHMYLASWSPGSGWTILPEEESEKIDCKKLVSLPHHEALCLGSQALALWSGKAWKVLPWTADIQEQLNASLSFEERVKLAIFHEKIFMLLDQSIFMWNAVQGWTQIALPLGHSKALGMLVEPQSQTLLLATQDQDSPAQLWSWQEDRWQTWSQLPKILPRGLQFMGLDQNSRLWTGPFRWDEQKKAWENPFDLQRSLQTSSGQIDRSGRVWIKSDELSCFYEKEVFCFPLEMFELGSSIQDFSGLPWEDFWSRQNPFANPSLRYRLYSIKPRGFHSWDPNVTEGRPSKDAAKLLSMNEAGEPSIWLGKSDVYQLKETGFEKMEMPRDLPKTLEYVEALFVSQQHQIFISDGEKNWVRDGDQWQKLSTNASISWEKVLEAKDGSLWTDQSWGADHLLHIEKNRLEKVELPQACTENFEGYTLLRGEQLWVLCAHSLFAKQQGLWSKVREWSNTPVRLLTGDPGSWDKLWIVTELSLDQAKIENLESDGKTLSSWTFHTPAFSLDQLRITGHAEQFVLYDLGTFWQIIGSRILEVPIDFRVNDLFPKEFPPAQPIQKAVMDPRGRVWFILYSGGLYRWDPDEPQ